MNPPPTTEQIIAINGEEHNGLAESIATLENYYVASMAHPPPVRWQCWDTGERGTIIRQRVGPDIFLTFLPSPHPEKTTLPRSKKGSRSPFAFGKSAYDFDISHIIRN